MLVNGVCIVDNDKICKEGFTSVNGQCTNTITETRGPPTSDVTINLAGNARIDARLDGINVTTASDGNIIVDNNGTIEARGGHGIHSVTDAGDITITNRHLITAQQDGIHARSVSGDISITNDDSGRITSNVGIYAFSGRGNVAVTNAGNITADVNGIHAQTETGRIGITNALGGEIYARLIGIVAQTGSGDIVVHNEGTIRDAATGIGAFSDFGNIVATNQDFIYAEEVGIRAFSRRGDVTVTNAGHIKGPDKGITAGSEVGLVSVNNTWVIDTSKVGVSTKNKRGDTEITNEGSISNTQLGIRAKSGSGDIRLTNTGYITDNIKDGIQLVTGAPNPDSSDAGQAGDIHFWNSGRVSADNTAFSAETRDGRIHVRNERLIESSNGTAIRTTSRAPNNAVTIENLVDSTISGADYGIETRVHGGRAFIDNRGTISGNLAGVSLETLPEDLPDSVPNIASVAQIFNLSGATISGGENGHAIDANWTGDIIVDNAGQFEGSVLLKSHDSTDVGRNGHVNVTNSGKIATRNYDGIQAITQAGNITIANTGANLASDHLSIGAADNGIYARSTSGRVEVNNKAGIKASNGAAIYAHSVTGDVAVDNSGNATGTEFAVKATSTDGRIDLNNSGEANASNGTAIRAHSDTGRVEVANSGNATGTEFAVKATSTDGEIDLTNSGEANASNGTAIRAHSVTGRVDVANSGKATGTELGLDVSSALGRITIDNSGWIEGGQAGVKVSSTPAAVGSARAAELSVPSTIIENRAGATIRNAANGRAIDATATSGPLAIQNRGDIIGSFAAEAGSSATFNNLIGGRFEASGSSDFGGAGSVFNNEGTVGIASQGTPADVSLDNLGVFNNTGTVTLQNTVSGDTFRIGGNYVGNAGSSVLLDFASELNSADRFIVSGNASGHTTVLAENLTPGTPFTLSAPLVEVHGDAAPGVFTLGNPQSVGPLDAVLLPQSGATGTDFVIGSVPNALGLAGAATTLPAARAIAAKGTDVVLNHVTEARDQLRAALGIVPPARRALAYAAAPATPDPVGEQLKPAPVVASGTATANTKIATWARAFGDVEDRDGRAVYGFAGSVFNVDLGYRQETAGLTAGADLLIPGLTSDTDGLLIGAFAGYLASNVEQDRSAGKQEFSGATLGLSATYLSGNFFTDLTFRTDILDLDIKDAGFRQSADLNNYVVTANAGYTFTMANNWYIEPTAGVEWIRTAFDRQTWLTANTVPLRNSNAFAGRAGARVGTSWTTDDNVLRIEPSLTALAYTIFNVSNGGLGGGLNNVAGITLPDDEGKVRALLQGSINVINLESGLSGFVRADAAFGEDVTAAGGKIGLRYQW